MNVAIRQKSSHECFYALRYCPGALLVSILTSYNKIWRTRNAARSSNGDCGKTTQILRSFPTIAIWRSHRVSHPPCCVVFAQSPFEDHTAFRVRHILLLVSILTSNAPGQWRWFQAAHAAGCLSPAQQGDPHPSHHSDATTASTRVISQVFRLFVQKLV